MSTFSFPSDTDAVEPQRSAFPPASPIPLSSSVERGMSRLHSSGSLHTMQGGDSPNTTDRPLSTHATPPGFTVTATAAPLPPSSSSTTTRANAMNAHTEMTHGGDGPSCTSAASRSARVPRVSPCTQERHVRYRTLRDAPVCTSNTWSSRQWVRVNVGGTTFTTTLATLCADPDSLLCAMCAPLTARAAALGPCAGCVLSSSTKPSVTSAVSAPTPTRTTITTTTTGARTAVAGGVHVDPLDGLASRVPITASPSSSADTTVAPAGTDVAGGGESLSPHAEVLPLADKGLLPLDADEHNSLLLDLDPEYFAPVLNYLRHGTLLIPASCNPRGVLAVATYLNVRGVVERLTPRQRVMPQYLFSWGSGSHGELGTQQLVDSEVPTSFRMTPFGVRVVQVALGANYSIALSDTGDVYSVGNADWGQLGLGNPKLLDVNPANRCNVQLVPRRIPLFEQQPAVAIAAGYAFAMAVTKDHHVYFWGNNNHAQGGLGAEYLDPRFKKMDTPCLIRTLEGKQIVQVGCGSFFGLARSADGEVYSWGLVECTGLGTVEEVRRRFAGMDVIGLALSNEGRSVVHTPQRIHFPTSTRTTIVHIHAGQWHSGAINDRGELFTWGVGYQGRLGHGDKEPAYTPKRVGGALAGHTVTDVACGSFHTVALTSRGLVFCWGDNASGQCGVSLPPLTTQNTSAATPEAVTSPCRVVGLELVGGGVARGVSCGRQHTAIIMEGPQPGCWESCCQLNDRGRPRGVHRQVYVVGERLRMSDKAAALAHNAPTSATGVEARGYGNATARFVSSSNPYHLPARRRGTSDAPHVRVPHLSSPSHRARPSSAEDAFESEEDGSMVMSATAFESPMNQLFQRVPGLDGLDVHRVVSGLHHTYVCAEAVRLVHQSQPGAMGGGAAPPNAVLLPSSPITAMHAPRRERQWRAEDSSGSENWTYGHHAEGYDEDEDA